MGIFRSLLSVLRVVLLVCLAVGLLSACGDDDDDGDQDDSVTVGIVNLTDALALGIDGYKAGMANLGYEEDQNITYIYDGPVGSIDNLDAAVQKLVDADVDIIFSLSTPATLAAKRVTAGTDIPVIFGVVTNPVVTGIVENPVEPEANITGVRTGGSEQKQLEWFQVIVPDLQRVLILHNPNDASSRVALDDVREAGDRLGIEIVAVETPDGEAVLAALQAPPDDIDGMLILPDSMVNAHLPDMIAFSLEQKIPLAGINPDHVDAGALFAFGHGHFEAGEQTARMTRQLLVRLSPNELPVETADFLLSINLQTADAFDITIADIALESAKYIVR